MTRGAVPTVSPPPADVRLAALHDRLARDGRVAVNEMAERLGVTPMTIRRDLEVLEASGEVRRVHGGAIATAPRPFGQRDRVALRAKATIGRKLADILPRRGVIALDASSTVHRAATLLEGDGDLVVVTNGIETFAALRRRPGVGAVLTGGVSDPRSDSLVGAIVADTMRRFSCHVFVCSAAAVNRRFAVMDHGIEESATKRAMAESASRVIVAVDNRKLGAQAGSRTCSWDDLDVLVTDLAPDHARLAEYREVVRVV